MFSVRPIVKKRPGPPRDDFRDAKSIIELLKENLTLWKEEEEGGNNIDDL